MKRYTMYTDKGYLLSIRHIQTNDAPYFVEIFEHMSPESRYRRFMQPLENPSPTFVWQHAEQIAKTDPSRQDGLIAFCDTAERPHMPVGAARYVVTEPGVAEVAVSVRDDMQGRGIGALLLQMVAEMARDNGLVKLVGTAQNGNLPLWHILEKLPFPLRRIPDGSYSDIELDLTREKTDVKTAVPTP